jgi:DNA ligase (NAD+)
MDENFNNTQYNQLVEVVNYHNYLYNVLDSPAITDLEFDKLLSKVREIEEIFPNRVRVDSPTQRVGGGISEKFSKVPHPVPILSLANAFDSDGLRTWQERIGKIDEDALTSKFVVEPKIDGLTIVLHYENGVLVQGATRGNGEIGEDITTNIKTIETIPLRIPVDKNGPTPPAKLVVRGEIFIEKDDFVELNLRKIKAGEKEYQNARNTAAGSLRQLDSSKAAKIPLKIFVYTLLQGHPDETLTQFESLELLKKYGFLIPKEISYCENIEEAVDACEKWIDKRKDIPYDIDGAVVKIDNISLYDGLGIVGKDPRGAIAFKFPAQEVSTLLENIGFKVGRTGVITPYADLKPVDIDGVIVKRATLHNFDFIEEKDIRVGDRVLVKRAGDVIPYVIGPQKQFRDNSISPLLIPTECPACDEKLVKTGNDVAWYCVNDNCPDQLIRKLEHYVSRTTLDIVGLGIKIVEQLIKEGMIKDISDLYYLDRDKLLALEGFQKKKVDNLFLSIENSKAKPPKSFLFALGMKGVGEVVANELIENFGSIEELMKSSVEELEKMEGIGPNIALSIVEWFANQQNLAVLERLKLAGMWPILEETKESDQLAQTFLGKIFVVTGTLPSMSRNDAKEFIQTRGGKVSSSISKKTSYLVAGENAGSKLEKAKGLNVTIISEFDLRQLAQL